MLLFAAAGAAGCSKLQQAAAGCCWQQFSLSLSVQKQPWAA